MENKPNSVKVNCDFCGKEIECPGNMLEKSEKHMCFECFQNPTEEVKKEGLKNVHVDMPMDEFDEAVPEAMTNSLVKEAFPEIWQERKKELKEMTKKELAEEISIIYASEYSLFFRIGFLRNDSFRNRKPFFKNKTKSNLSFFCQSPSLY